MNGAQGDGKRSFPTDEVASDEATTVAVVASTRGHDGGRRSDSATPRFFGAVVAWATFAGFAVGVFMPLPATAAFVFVAGAAFPEGPVADARACAGAAFPAFAEDEADAVREDVGRVEEATVARFPPWALAAWALAAWTFPPRTSLRRAGAAALRGAGAETSVPRDPGSAARAGARAPAAAVVERADAA